MSTQIQRLVRTMDIDELRNINTIVVGRIKVLKAKKLKEKKDFLKVGDRVTFKTRKVFLAIPCSWNHQERVKCRGYKVGVVLSMARTFAKVRVGPKTFKCRISGLEPTLYDEGTEWYEKPLCPTQQRASYLKRQDTAWPTVDDILGREVQATSVETSKVSQNKVN
jgi:hypothetical protein